MKRLILVFFLFLGCTVISAQISPVVPSTGAIANASVADSKGWSAFGNPANIGYVADMTFGFQYENRYLLAELSTKSLNFVLPSDLVNTGLSVAYSGYSLYNEILLGAGFSRNFSNKFSMGVQLNYLTAYFASADKYFGSFFPQIGLNVSFTPALHLGFSTFNPFQSNIKTSYTVKKLPSIFSLGCEYFLSPELAFRVQADKEISSNYRLAMGTEYSILDFLTVKAGAYHTDYLVPCIGFKSDFGSFTFHLNGELHPILGLVSIASVQYSFKK